MILSITDGNLIILIDFNFNFLAFYATLQYRLSFFLRCFAARKRLYEERTSEYDSSSVYTHVSASSHVIYPFSGVLVSAEGGPLDYAIIPPEERQRCVIDITEHNTTG